jgi:hypothetical protein
VGGGNISSDTNFGGGINVNYGQTAGFNFNRQRSIIPAAMFSNVCKLAITDWSSRNEDRQQEIWQKRWERKYAGG